MFVVDCKSPIAQKILEKKLSKYISDTEYDYIITDREDIFGENILKVGSEIFFPFSEEQIQKFLEKPKDEIEELLEVFQDKEVITKEQVFEIVEKHQKLILKEIEELFEKAK